MAKKQPLAVLHWNGSELRIPTRGDRIALEGLERRPEGHLLEVYAYKPPTNKQERFVHWLFRLGAENAREDGPKWTDAGIKMACKIQFGWVDGMVVRPGKEARWNFRSLAEMDEDDMKKFIDLVVQFIESEVAPGIDIEALKREAKEKSARRKW